MKRIITIICLAACLGCYANWTKIVEPSHDPLLYTLFGEVANMERGIVRFVALNCLETTLNGEDCPYDDVQLDYHQDDEYFSVLSGQQDDGNGETYWQKIQAKLWRPASNDSAQSPCYLATYLIDSSPQQEYRYLYFYEYDPQTQMLTSIPHPIDLGYDKSEIQYDITSDGVIEVKHWGEHLCNILWNGKEFVLGE